MQASSVSSLKRKCRRLGLPTSGSKEDLVKRLRVNGASVAAEDTLTPEENIDCLLALSVPLSTAADMIENARTEFQAAARNECLQEGEIADRTIIANTRGSFLAHMAATCKQNQEVLLALQEDHRGLREELRTKTDELHAKTDELERSTTGFREFRHRFLSVYKRDILGDIDATDRKYIQSGNHIAHGGNCKRDAELYTGINRRHDDLIFQKIYGLLPAVIAAIEYVPTINLLNRHATIITNRQYVTTPIFQICFQDFVTALAAQGFPSAYLETRVGPVNEYWKFWNSVNTEVSMVN